MLGQGQVVLRRDAALAGRGASGFRRWRRAGHAALSIGRRGPITACARSLFRRLLPEEAIAIGVLGRIRIQRPLRKLLVPREPDVGKLLEIADDLFERRDDHRAPPEVAVQGQYQHRHRLVAVEIVERALVDVPQVARARPQHPVVGEVAVGDGRDRAVLGLDAVRQVDIGHVGMPSELLGGEEIDRVLGEGEHRAQPAVRALARALAERIDALADGRALLVGRHVGEQRVLGPVVSADVVAGLHDLLDAVGIDLGAARVDEEGRGNLQPVERADHAPDADTAAVGRPCVSGQVDLAGLEMGGLHRISRRLPFRPGLVHHRDRDRDPLPVRPRKCRCR